MNATLKVKNDSEQVVSLILTDEPTRNLDRENAEIVIRSLVGFADTGGSVLLVTHNPYVVQHATKTLHLENGSMRNN